MWKIAIFKIAELYCCLHRFCFCSKLQRPALEYVSMGCWRENIESPWIPSIEGRRLRLLGETVKRWSGKLMKLVVSSGADSQILRCLSSHFVKELTMRSTSCQRILHINGSFSSNEQMSRWADSSWPSLYVLTIRFIEFCFVDIKLLAILPDHAI